MSHTPLEHLEPCRCLVKITEMGSQILYCPLHAAAPALLEALKAFEAGFRDGNIQWTKPRQSDNDAYHPANTLMCNAIANAEGRG